MTCAAGRLATLVILSMLAACGGDASSAGEDSGTSIDAAVDRDAQPGDADASIPVEDASIPVEDASTLDDDASAAPDACVAPRCPPIPVGCEVVGGTECTCGTIVCPANACRPACTRGEYCRYPTSCGGEGTCETRPEVCIDVFDPVCGCDGTTYSNACDAASAGQSVRHEGACMATADCRTEGCPSGSTCEPCRGGAYACIPSGSAC